MLLYKTPSFIKATNKDLVWHIQDAQKNIYLSFDDGPIPDVTPYILDVLDEYDAKATFFVVGENVNKYPEILLDTAKRGHAIGNHTFNHISGWKTDNDAYIHNMEMADRAIFEVLGESPNLFRPPYGLLRRSQIKSLIPYKSIIMWDVLAHDYSDRHSMDKAYDKIITKTGRGSIIVFHDSLKAEKKVKYLLPKYLEHFSKEGYKFIVIPDA